MAKHFLIPGSSLVVSASGYTDTGESMKPYPFEGRDVFTTDEWINDDPGLIDAFTPIFLGYTAGFAGKPDDDEGKLKWEAWRDGKTPVPQNHLVTIWRARNHWHAEQEWFLAKHGECMDDAKARLPRDDFLDLWEEWDDYSEPIYAEIDAALEKASKEAKQPVPA